MTTGWIRIMIVIAAVTVSACGKGEGERSSSVDESARPAASQAGRDAAEPAGAEAGHAPAGVIPGSYEDWCAEHGVPESACTRCNADLIPAFQATGDWCPEHGLPESQCLTCNPDLVIARPPKS